MAVEMMHLRPFFSYFGSKWTSVPKYPKPMFGRIVEPFAGSACYATRYAHLQVTLADIDPVIAGLWEYLIGVKEHEILSLPIVFDDVNEIKGASTEAKHLIGFWIGKGRASPAVTPSTFAITDRLYRERKGSIWGDQIKWRIAQQLKYIRHWNIVNESYTSLDNDRVTWFIDPPYQNSCGRGYAFDKVDFSSLAEWCRSRNGLKIVCEQEGADWLPFKFSHKVTSTNVKLRDKGSAEVSWVSLNKPTVTKPVSLWE